MALLAATGALLALGGWAFATPVGSSPDDDYHLPSIWCAQGAEPGRCETTDDPEQRAVPEFASGASICFARDPELSGACQADVGTELAPTDRGNWVGAYPPVFYRAMSYLVAADVGESVLLMRLANGALAVVLLAAVYFAVPRERRALVVMPILALSLPLVIYFVPSTNPSSWTITGCAALLPALLGVTETRGPRRLCLAALSVLATIVAAGARADGALFVLMIVGLVVIVRLGSLRRAPLAIVALAACAAIAGAFFLSAGHRDVLAGNIEQLSGSNMSLLELVVHNLLWLPVLWFGVVGIGDMGVTGWLDTRFPPMAAMISVAVWAAVVLRGARSMFPTKRAALGLAGLAAVVYPLYILTETRARVGEMMQPRYLLPCLIVVTALSWLGDRGNSPRWSVREARWLAAALAAAHAVMLHAQIRRYVTGTDVAALGLDDGKEWWWTNAPSATAVWLAASVGFAMMAWLVMSASADRVSRSSVHPEARETRSAETYESSEANDG